MNEFICPITIEQQEDLNFNFNKKKKIYLDTNKFFWIYHNKLYLYFFSITGVVEFYVPEENLCKFIYEYLNGSDFSEIKESDNE